MKLHTISRDKMLYETSATYENGNITVLKGSKINLNKADKYAPCEEVRKLREDPSLFENSILLHDVTFSSLSTAATFVTGRVANGMIVWKTEDNKYVKYSLQKGGEN